MSSRLLAYLSRPFPKAEGFSAYRMPGVLVRVPVLLAAVEISMLLCRHTPWFPAALALFAMAGLYVGRDLAILAHYNVLITLGVWIGAGFLVFDVRQVSGWALSATAAFPQLPLIVTMFVLAGFVGHVAYWSRQE